MKNLKLAVIALFTLAIVGSASAQDANNPWVVGFGINSVDTKVADLEMSDFLRMPLVLLILIFCLQFLDFLLRNT